MAPPTPLHGRGVLGIGLAALSAAAFTATTIATVRAYEGGAEPLAAITIRFAGAVVVLFAMLRLSGASMRLPLSARLSAFGLGGVLAAQSWCLYNSFAHIAVGLTFTIFYVYPMLVAAIAVSTGQARLTPVLAAALAAAFCGLVLVFDATGAGVDPYGAGLAVGASLAWTCVIVASARMMRERDPRPLMFHMQAAAGAVYVVVCLADGDVALPETAAGWAGYAALPVFYSVATLCFFGAVAAAGSIRSSLVMNLEPVFTIAAGFLILGQALTGTQLLGAALVIAAVVAVRARTAETGGS